MKKAVIAMSGGVDSSVAALLTRDKGFETVGIMLKLHTNDNIKVCSHNTCCSLEDAEDARNVADKLGIPFYMLNFISDFETQVIDRFVDAYENGRTPNPCIDCNRYIKFEMLMKRAEEIGFDYVVTGHYAVVEKDVSTGRYLLKRGLDKSKDQSYVLYSLTQKQLSRIMFPLGSMKKEQTRQIAEENGLINARKKDSQDICFVEDGDYAGFIREYTGKDFPKGNFVGVNGEVLGEHKGIIHYTVGQRKGLGLSLKKPMYVGKIDLDKNEVLLCEENYLFAKELTANKINLISCDKIEAPMRVKAKIRYRHTEQPATVEQTGEDELKIVFDEPQRAITKGQAVVLYDGDIVVGGGTIVN